MDLDFKTVQIIELGSAMRLEKPILIGRFEVYIWNIEHAKKHSMGPTFILHKHTMDQAARNYVVPTTEIFMIVHSHEIREACEPKERCDFETSKYECDSMNHSKVSIPWSWPSLVQYTNKPHVKADDLYSLGLAIWH